jgi:hypothetical protein
MNKYKVFFTYRDKKYQVEVEAPNETDAECHVLNYVQVLEVRLIEGVEPSSKITGSESVDYLKGLFNL